MKAESEESHIYACMNESSCNTPKTNTTYCKSTILQYEITIQLNKQTNQGNYTVHGKECFKSSILLENAAAVASGGELVLGIFLRGLGC